jgi:hypothetical protein
VVALSGYPALDVFIGLAFLYFLLSIVASSINEAIASILGLRAKTLEKGIRELLGSREAADQFYSDIRVKALSRSTLFSFLRGDKPSYIPSRVFALALLDTVAPALAAPPGDEAAPGKGLVGPSGAAAPKYNLLEAAEKFAATVSNDSVRTMLRDALAEAGTKGEKVSVSLEHQFDEAMQRVSGWYKRLTQLILFAIAIALVAGMNADSFTIGQRLWKDDILRNAVVSQASATVTSGHAACAGTASQTAAQTAAKCVDQVKQLNIPLGWSKATAPKTVQSGLGKGLGLLLTAFAILLGAPFWFDTLSKLAQLRGTGRASANPSTPEGATTTETAVG